MDDKDREYYLEEVEICLLFVTLWIKRLYLVFAGTSLIFFLFFSSCCLFSLAIYSSESSKKIEATVKAEETIYANATAYAETHRVITAAVNFDASPIALFSPTATPVILSSASTITPSATKTLQPEVAIMLKTVVAPPGPGILETPTLEEMLFVSPELTESLAFSQPPTPLPTPTPLSTMTFLSPSSTPLPTSTPISASPTATPAPELSIATLSQSLSEDKDVEAGNLEMAAVSVKNQVVTSEFDYKVIRKEQWDPCRNQGNHIIAIYVLDSNGNGIPHVQLKVFWGNGGPDEQTIIVTGQKPEISSGYVEFGMYGDDYSVQVFDGSSEIASGLGYSGPDQACHEPGRENPVGNSQGHYSWDVVFQRIY